MNLDIAICSECRGRFHVDDCETEMESDGWEYPEYLVFYCPDCEDGGCVDDWDLSHPVKKWFQSWWWKHNIRRLKK